ncbi:MAG: sulfatase-like hydrolase/transferase, partial [Planctomycetota bacterium]
KMPGVVADYVAAIQGLDARVVALEPIRDAYDEKVLEVDALIERLLDALADRGLLDDTLFVLSADHGENTFDRELYFRHGTAQQSVLHVPLVVKLPGDRCGGRRVSERVSLVDLLPTFAELVGLEPGPFEHHGQSLLRAFDGARPERPVLVRTGYLGQRAVVRGRWKLVVSDPAEPAYPTDALYVPRYWKAWAEQHPELAVELAGEHGVETPPPVDPVRIASFSARHPSFLDDLKRFFAGLGTDRALFDLTVDPEERRDLADQHPELADELARLLENAEREDRALREAVADGASSTALDAATLERLAELGYADPASDRE